MYSELPHENPENGMFNLRCFFFSQSFVHFLCKIWIFQKFNILFQQFSAVMLNSPSTQNKFLRVKNIFRSREKKHNPSA
jgi:hypothetical protein